MKEEAFPDIYMMTSSRSIQDILLSNMFPNILISVYPSVYDGNAETSDISS